MPAVEYLNFVAWEDSRQGASDSELVEWEFWGYSVGQGTFFVLVDEE